METKQIIQTSANVIRITSLAKGNLYKRFDDNYTWFGIVKGIFNDGVNTIIEAIEYRSSWSSMETQLQVFKGERDIIIFPATLEDFQIEFKNHIEKCKNDIEKLKTSIIEKEEQIKITQKLVSGEMQKELSTPNFKEMTQEEYDDKMLLN